MQPAGEAAGECQLTTDNSRRVTATGRRTGDRVGADGADSAVRDVARCAALTSIRGARRRLPISRGSVKSSRSSRR